MKPAARRTLLLLGLLLGLPAVAAEEAPHEHPNHGPGQGAMHHPDMKGPTARFHELMEPLWHSAPGPERTAQACAQGKEIAARIKAVARERGPVKLLGQMTETAARLAPACAAKQAGDVDQALDTLHQQFHELMGMH